MAGRSLQALPVKRQEKWKLQQQHVPELHLCLRESGDERATLIMR
jgi:hypothetical protein